MRLTQFIVAVFAQLALMTPAKAGGGFDDEPIHVHIDSIVRTAAGWHLELSVETPDDSSVSFSFEPSDRGSAEGEKCRAADGACAVDVTTEGLAEGEPYVLVARRDGPVDPNVGNTDHVYLTLKSGTLIEQTPSEHIASSLDASGGVIARGVVMPPAPGTEHLAPWDNPSLSEEQKQRARALFANTEAGNDGVDRVAGGLSSGTEARADTGCGAGEVGLGLGVTFALIVVAYRRRGLAVMVAATLAVGVITHDASARTVYGYISFWDTRNTRRTASGSRLTGSPSDPNCCYVGIPEIQVQIKQAPYGVLGTVFTDSQGWFIATGIGGDPSKLYDIGVVFERNFQPGWVRITQYDYPTDTVAEGLVGKVSLPQEFNDIGNISVNAQPDTTSLFGDLATVWDSAWRTLAGLEGEGETRHRHVLGGGTNTYDRILIRYSSVKARGVNCGESVFRTYSDIARSGIPFLDTAQIYYGRVTGCSTPAPAGGSFWHLPAFPTNPGQEKAPTSAGAPSSGSEGLAAYFGALQAVMMVALWNPQVASVAQIHAELDSLGYACITDTESNSNASAYWPNTAYAIWDYIDSDTGGNTPGYNDSLDLTMTQYMDEVRRLQLYTGTGDQHAGELVWTPGAQNGCGSNEAHGSIPGCANGDVCLQVQGRCYSGDPHGNNIQDIMWLTYTTSFVNTALSSACLAGQNGNSPGGDHVYPFDRGYRDD
ncbi:MAG: hypothetical protein U1F43_18700 [Myxococcota bacterium]